MSDPAAKYAAFISYRHVEPDRTWAKRLHTLLENYRTPKALVQRGVRERLGRIFRDEEELAASADLSAEINTALDQSAYLIVVCSPETPRSKWVNAEVARFRELGRHDRILALLISGEPHDSFPSALCEIRRTIVAPDDPVEQIEIVEPLAADVRPRASYSKSDLRNTAQLRFAATILGVSFDDLRQRDLQRRLRYARGLIALTSVVALVILGLAFVAWQQRQVAVVQRSKAEQLATTNIGLAKAAELKRVEAEQKGAENRQLAIEKGNEAERANQASNRNKSLAHQGSMAEFANGRRAWEEYENAWSRGETARGIAGTTKGHEAIAFLTRALELDPENELAANYLYHLLVQCPPRPTRYLRGAVPLGESEHSDNGKRLLSVGVAGIHTWDLATGKLVGPPIVFGLETFELPVVNHEYSRVLVFDDEDSHQAHLYDIATGKQIGAPLSHEGELIAAKFSPDDSQLVTVAADGTGQIWDARNAERVGQTMYHAGAINCVEFSTNGKLVVTGSDDKTVRLWRVPEGTEFGKPLAHRASVVGLCYCDCQPGLFAAGNDQPASQRIITFCDHRVIAAGRRPPGTPDQDLEMNVWDPRTQQSVGSSHRSKFSPYFHRPQFSADFTRLLITWGGSGNAAVPAEPPDESSKPPTSLKEAIANEVLDKLLGPASERRATVRGERFAVVDLQSGNVIGTPIDNGPTDLGSFSPWKLLLMPDGGRIIAINKDRCQFFDVESGTASGQELQLSFEPLLASLSPDGELLLVQTERSGTQLWNLSTGQPVAPAFQHGETSLLSTFSRDGTSIINSGIGSEIEIWSIARLIPLQQLLSSQAPDYESGLTTDQKHRLDIHSSSSTTTISLVETQATQEAIDAWRWAMLSGNYSLVDRSKRNPIIKSVQLDGYGAHARAAPNGQRLVAWERKGELFQDLPGKAAVWDLRSDTPSKSALDHPGGILNAYFSADGHRLASTAQDNQFYLWDLTLAEPIGRRLVHDASVRQAPLVSITFSPDGKHFISTSRDYSSILWDAATGEKVRDLALADEAAEDWDRDSRDILAPARFRAAFAADGNTAAVIVGSRISFFTIPAGEQWGRQLQHSGAIEALFSADKSRIITTSERGDVQIWDAATGIRLGPALRPSFGPDVLSAFRNVTPYESEFDAPIQFAAFSSDQRSLIAKNHLNTIRFVCQPVEGTKATSEAVLKLGRICSGLQFNDRGELEISSSTDDIGDALVAELPPGAWTQLGAWLQDSSPGRIVAPDSQETVRDVALRFRDAAGRRSWDFAQLLQLDPLVPDGRTLLADSLEKEANFQLAKPNTASLVRRQQYLRYYDKTFVPRAQTDRPRF